VQARADFGSSPDEAIMDWDRFVEQQRSRVDREYEAAVGRHVSINGYLNSPIKGSPELEGLLDLVLANGYSIDDLLSAYVRLHMCCALGGGIEALEAGMLAAGKSPEDVEAEIPRFLEQRHQRRLVCVADAFDAQEDIEFAERLIATVPEPVSLPGPTHEFLIASYHGQLKTLSRGSTRKRAAGPTP